VATARIAFEHIVQSYSPGGTRMYLQSNFLSPRESAS